MIVPASIINDTLVKSKRAWLITWEWMGDHAKVQDRFVAMLNYRYSSDSMTRMVEQIYVSSQFALHEQLAYVKNRKSSPYCAQSSAIEVGEEMREKLGFPSSIAFSDSITYGGNPWLWARIVHDLKAYADEQGNEHLRWKERCNTIWEDGELKSGWEELHMV